MSSIEIEGGHCLHGEVRVQGSKNATLPVMAAALLNSGISVLRNYPDIEDVRQMKLLLESLGCRILLEKDKMIIDSQPAKETTLNGAVTGKIRASSVLLGPMLARFHHVKMAQPGGCRIGKRPLDIHMNVFKAFGASWSMSDEFIEVECVRLHPAQIRMNKRSVGATQNAIMVAAFIKGKSKIFNGAVEPEVLTLCDYLKATGTFIQIDDDNTITVEGRGCSHASIDIPGDRIVAGTYMGAVTACGGEIKLSGFRLWDCRGFLNVFTGMGMKLKTHGDEAVTVAMTGKPLAINSIKTEPYPGFPTDMQSIVMTCAAQAEGVTTISENIFDNRMGAAKELNRMNARIKVLGNTAVINGVEGLEGAAITAQDLRGAAALVIAGMSAEGVTFINHTEYIDRGYVDLCGTFNRLGARIHGK